MTRTKGLLDQPGFKEKWAVRQKEFALKQSLGFYKPVMTFEVTQGQKDTIREWLDEVIYPAAIAKQKLEHPNDEAYKISWEMGVPYCGAIGGDVKYTFSPTGLGDGLVVSTCWNDETLNVTDYDSW